MQQEHDVERKGKRQFWALWMMMRLLFLIEVALFITIMTLELRIGLLKF